MASITSAGIGSGLDVESLITKMMSLEKRPLNLLQTQASTIQTKISAFGSLSSGMSTLRDAALALTRNEAWSATTGKSADATAVSVSSNGTAAAGDYSVEVQSLAKSQSVVSGTYASADALVGEGSLQVSFSGQPDFPPLNVSISAGDTLATVRSKINAAGAGVSAVIVNDATGARIVISSTKTGTENGFSVSGTGGGAAFSFDPANPQGSSMTQTQAAEDARATINGLPVTSASNTLSDVVDGVTLTLNKVSSSPVQVKVAKDDESMKASIQAFVEAYNGIAKQLAAQVKYDDTTKQAGTLQGDSTAVSMQRQLRGLITSTSGASGTFPNLSSVGLEMQRDGTLKINDTKLTAALQNPVELKKVFANSDPVNNANNGIARMVQAFGDNLLGSDGALTTRTEGLSDSLKMNTDRQDQALLRLDMVEKRMRAQYTALDTQMGSLSALSTYMTNQVAAWNKSS